MKHFEEPDADVPLIAFAGLTAAVAAVLLAPLDRRRASIDRHVACEQMVYRDHAAEGGTQ
ncbi:hypothetical protein AM571_PC01103 (plasmid) [Rhizobium etli 8C-3]|uniref:Uncharacterized protein n=1 Tax=Rhizobium etli 8C-3 TaxID=538025 RepID=A0A1L5PF73_RHIET|nr:MULTISPECIES: hypothetical protein [Rhizobium]APO78838.1 hypothetical protein AM571_PC01103 [Rhizobium etli 8C-3]